MSLESSGFLELGAGWARLSRENCGEKGGLAERCAHRPAAVLEQTASAAKTVKQRPKGKTMTVKHEQRQRPHHLVPAMPTPPTCRKDHQAPAWERPSGPYLGGVARCI